MKKYFFEMYNHRDNFKKIFFQLHNYNEYEDDFFYIVIMMMKGTHIKSFKSIGAVNLKLYFSFLLERSLPFSLTILFPSHLL